MKIDQFLKHHGIAGNPFSEEDAQTDTVFKRSCLETIHHPAWDKFFGSPSRPLHRPGLRREGERQDRAPAPGDLRAGNLQRGKHPDARVFVISYDDFNPFLDHFRDAVRAKDAGEALERWRLQDHMDAILALGVTQLIDAMTADKVDLTSLTLDQRRDLLLLAALYDQSTREPIEKRWSRLRRRSGFRPLWSRQDLQIGFGTTLAVLVLIAVFPGHPDDAKILPWLVVPVLLGWLYWGWRLPGPSGTPGRSARPSASSAATPPRSGGSSSGSSRASSAASRSPRPSKGAARSVTSCSASSRASSAASAITGSSSWSTGSTSRN